MPLISSGIKMHYPLPLMRLSLSTYVWPRRVVMDGLAEPVWYPTRGIVAGSIGATRETKAVLAPPLLAARVRVPAYITTTYVDDVSGTTRNADSNQAIVDAYNGSFAVRVEMEALGFSFGKSKQALLCNFPKVLLRLRELFGHGVGAPGHAKRLGVDHSLGNPRAQGRTPTTRSRFKKAMMRARRIAGVVRRLPKHTHQRR